MFYCKTSFVSFSKIGDPSDSYVLVKQNAECNEGHLTIIPERRDICWGDCTLLVNREEAGIANCFQLLQADSECGNKWFEVGDNLCMCYSIELLKCNITSDPYEDLYKISELIWDILVVL